LKPKERVKSSLQRDETALLYTIKFKLAIKNETLSLDGEKLIPAVGAECCFVHETFFSNTMKEEITRKYILSNKKLSI